jgi:predicted glycoside hydrolase/deacetylase ChbG (UPF0249 family)
MIVNMPTAEYASALIPKYPNLSVGIHLNLTLGRPLTPPSQIPSLIDDHGYFHNHREMFRRAFRFKLNPYEVEKELSAQIERFMGYGVEPTHCDSHHHIADCPGVFKVKIKLLKKYNIKRLRTHRGWYHRDINLKGLKKLPDTVLINIKKFPNRTYYEIQHLHCRMKGFIQPDERYGFAKLISDKKLGYNAEGFRTLIENCPQGVVEYVVHPGLLSEDTMDEPEFREQRKTEYELLMNPECLRICENCGVQLINFIQF